MLYGGDGDDGYLTGGKGEDVIYGGDGDDLIDAVSASFTGFPRTKERDEIYCGEGEDHFTERPETGPETPQKGCVRCPIWS